MIPLQEVNFHLTHNQVVFSHLVQQHDGSFTAQLSQPYSMSDIPQIKYYMWLQCPAGSSAADAFSKIYSALKANFMNNDRSLVKVNNPCSTEFLTVDEQLDILSSAVPVKVNEPI